MSLINYKSTLSNYRREIKPKPTENGNPAPVEFGNYTPVTNNLAAYQDDRYSFSTKKLESFERKLVNEPFTTDSILKKDSLFDNDNITKKDLTVSKVVNNKQEPFVEIKTAGNNEKSPIDIPPKTKTDDKSLQAKTINPINQDDKIVPLKSKFELNEKIKKFEAKQLEKLNSTYDTSDTINKTTPSGRYESEKNSVFGFNSNNKPSTNAFSDKFNKGFQIKNGNGFTDSGLNYAWIGGNENAPSTSGFTKFAKFGITNFDQEKLPPIKQSDNFSNRYNKNFIIKQNQTQFTQDGLGFTKIKAVDYFNNEYSKNFELNSKPLESSFTDIGLNYGLNNLETVNFFDTNKTYTNFGFVKNQSKYGTDFNNSALDWGLKGATPSTDFFDKINQYTATGFRIRQQVLNTDFTKMALDWGLNGQNPATNYFDVSNQYTNNGFTIKQQSLESDFNSSALDWGLKGTKPSTNYFDYNKQFTNTGFKINQKIYETDFTKNALDYGLNGIFPNVNYFDVINNYTKSGFTIKQKIYETDFNNSALDWGLQGKLPATNYFDLTNKVTKNGFVIKQKILSTDFNSAALDWGLKGRLPATNYFDLNGQFTINGFVIKQAKFITDFTGPALDWGLKGLYPSTNYFDLTNKFTNQGFVIKQQILATDFNTPALDWGLKGSNPTTNFFDVNNSYTTTGFTFKQQPLTTDFNTPALDWGLKGIYPTTNYFDITNQYTNTGFTFKQPLLSTDFNSSALDWGLKGAYPTTNYFDITNQFTDTGFTFRQQLLTTDFNSSALDWGLKGIYPTTNYFDVGNQYTNTGFTFKQPLLSTDFNSSALDWGLKGIYPTTNYFDIGKQFTDTGFTFRQQLLTTDFNSSALDWGLKGLYPTTNYFDITNQYTNTGFTIRQQALNTDFSVPALDWGLKGVYPSTDYFDQPHRYTLGGFVVRQGIYNTDFTTLGLDYSLVNIPPTPAGINSANVTNIFGRQYAETNFFDLQNQNTTKGFHVLARPLEPTSYKTDSTSLFSVPASDFEIGRIGSPVYKIDSQLVKSPIFFNVGFIKNNRSSYSELIRTKNYVSFLGDVSTKRNSPSLLDLQYQKYSLQDDAVNFSVGLLGRQPYITRGFQTKGVLENERWGYGLTFDDGLIRGGATTVAERIEKDVIRLTKWSLSTKGLLYNIKQIGLQLTNPNTETGPLGPTKIYQPLSPLLAAGVTAFGQHPPRHGLIPFVTSGKYEDVIKDKTVLFDATPLLSNRNIEISSELSLLSTDKRVVIPSNYKRSGEIIDTISALTGPDSVYGIGRTNFYRNNSSIPPDAYQKYSPDINPLFTPGRYLDYQRNLIYTYDISDVRINRNVELAQELGFFQDWYELPFDKNENSVEFYFGQGIRRLSGEPYNSTKIHRFSVSIPNNALQKYSTNYQYASAFSISNVKGKDQLLSIREPADSSGTTSMLKNIYLAFQGDNNISLLFKDNKNSPDKHILNFGIDGNNESVQYIKSLSSRINAIYPSSLDVYSPHTVRNPIPYSFGGDLDSLSFGAWSKDRNVNRPFISELEQYGIISKRLKGFYAPERMTLGRNVTDTRTSLRLYNVGFEESPTVSTVVRAKIGPLSNDALEARSEGKFKLSRLYDIMLEYANKYKTPNDVFNAEFQNAKSYDDDDNIDIKFFIKNLLNPLNKIVENSPNGAFNTKFININKKLSDSSLTYYPTFIYNPSSIEEYSVSSYLSIPDGYAHKNRTQVQINPSSTDTNATPKTVDLNSRRFHDFRYSVHNFTQKEEGNVFLKRNGRVNFVTNPEIIKYRSNNLENAAGYGRHGLPGVDRTNPVLSIAFGPSSAGLSKRVANGIREIQGEQYGGNHVFRGDRVNLVDFRHDKSTTDINEIYELSENSLIPGKKDLIEFYVTGMGNRDKVIVFRAAITELNDNFNPSWETVKYLNRADPVYIYKGFEREVSVVFDVAVTSRDELRTRWRSLNALAGFTAPEYINSPDPTLNGRMKAPLMKLTLGHLFRATPCIITSLNYTFDNSQVVWETAKLKRWVNGQEIEETITTNDLDDPAGCVALQLPKMIRVSMNLKIIGNYRPQSNGGASGYPDMGVFYQLYASDDSANDGQLPRKGGIYVNYFNRECTVLKLPPEQPKERVIEVIEQEPKKVTPPKEEVKINKVETVPEDEPKKSSKDDQQEDKAPIKTVQESIEEAPIKNKGVTSKKKPRKTNSAGAKDPRADAASYPSSVNSPRTAAGQAIPYP